MASWNPPPGLVDYSLSTKSTSFSCSTNNFLLVLFVIVRSLFLVSLFDTIFLFWLCAWLLHLGYLLTPHRTVDHLELDLVRQWEAPVNYLSNPVATTAIDWLSVIDTCSASFWPTVDAACKSANFTSQPETLLSTVSIRVSSEWTTSGIQVQLKKDSVWSGVNSIASFHPSGQGALKRRFGGGEVQVPSHHFIPIEAFVRSTFRCPSSSSSSS